MPSDEAALLDSDCRKVLISERISLNLFSTLMSEYIDKIKNILWEEKGDWYGKN